ncbi:MAG TPA: TonB-dependent receptor [Mediterranea massiliensis]|uniref:TonB-dependent receptor n=1 Tax=Mediterranea massiliensis TaxID=1841865 RepID=A0A921HW27_9BACT|nr:TonB-dependent receptor [Mediterranea massiliensis]HJF91289.1 TonB-dependent receptor [Mediterranea massiliensis]
MKLKTLVLLWILLVSGLAAAQNSAVSTFQLKGILLDSLTQEGEPYATIRVARKSAPGKPVKMLVSGLDGRFKENMKGTGNFVLTITSVGRNPIVKNFSVKAGQKLVDFGTLYVTDASNELGQVEIVAQKPLVKADIDKIEYNVKDDPDSETNTLLEMLRKVPMVTVDGEDNIKVNGSSSFKVYVNGKPNNMMSNNPTEVLKSMPANTIKHIEVITNPGPKYDAEGVGGILNIVTEGGGFEGYTVTLSGNVSNRGAGGGVFGTVQKGKFTVSARYNYNYNDSPRSYSGGTQRATDPHSEVANLDYEGSSKGDGSFQSGSMEASYEIDSLNLISASFGLWGGGNSSNGGSNYVGNSPLDNHLLYQYGIGSHSKSSWYSIDGGIDYQRLSPTIKGRMFTLSYKVNTRPQTSDSYSEYDIAYGHDDWTDYLRRLQDQHNDGSQNTTEHTFQADYTTPIGEMHTIESGVKYILRNNSSDNDRYLRTSADNADYVFDDEYSTHYRHQNDIIAAYLGYGLKWKKLSGRLGVRYEHTIEDVKYLLGRGDDFRKNYDDVVPSASLGWKLTDLSNLRVGYNMRIYRPGIWYLNPYLDDSNPSSISQGNPELDSEHSHAFDLSYSNFTPKFNINLSARYSFTNNSIQSVTSLVSEDDIPDFSEDKKTGKDVLYTTYQNIGKSRNLNLSAYVNWNATKDTRIYANLFGGYTSLKGAEGLENDGWNLFAFGGAQQTFKHDWRLSVNVFGQTPWIMLQGKGSSFFSYSVNLNKSFLNRRLSLSAFASNFFQKYNKFESHIEGQGFLQDSWNKYPQMRFGFSVSYRIGELKASVKKAARTITNDDVKSGGSSTGAGGGAGGE